MTSQEEHYLMFREIGWLDADREEVHEELEVCGRCVPKHAHFATWADVPTGPCMALRVAKLRETELKRIQTFDDLPPGFGFELGVRDKGPQDPDYDPASTWVQRVPDGSMKAWCGDGWATGWQDTADVKAIAAEHLAADHGLDAREWRPDV